MGDPILTRPSLAPASADIPSSLIEDLIDSMRHKKGLGIAAPQLGYSTRVIVFECDHNPRYPKADPIPLTVLINPQYEVLSDTLIPAWEGCLSVPGLRGLVDRYEKIRYSGYNEQGDRIERVATGFHARVIQHEVDHLDGILFPFRIRDMRYFGFESVLSL